MEKILTFINDSEIIKFNFNIKRSFKKISKITFKLLNLNNQKQINCILITENEMLILNKKQRNKIGLTDVISFAFNENEIKNYFLGEIYICSEVAKRQAINYNHSFEREVCFLFVHGLLHLLGYDHNEKEEEKEMFDLQKMILKMVKL